MELGLPQGVTWLKYPGNTPFSVLGSGHGDCYYTKYPYKF
ncbi:unnamed protein product [Acidithrix sp. C25]|nr:unnamed protein product [Acidithrix sp. C25]